MKALVTLAALCAICLWHNFDFAQEMKLPTRDAVNVLAANYQAERDDVVKRGLVRRFQPPLIERADEFAKRGAAALNAGQYRQADDAFRQARWLLPYQSAHMPDHVARVLGELRLRHALEVHALAFSPDGSRLASAAGDHTVKIWDLGNGHEIVTYTGHSDAVRCVAFSPDGKSVASCEETKEIKIWDAASGKDLRTIKGEGLFTGSLVFAPDGKNIIAAHAGPPGHNGGMVTAFDIGTGNPRRTIKDFRMHVHALAFNRDGSILGTGGDDGMVRLWQYPAVADNAAGPDYWSQQDPGGKTAAIAFSPDNRTLARLGADGIKLYNLVLPGSPFQISAPRRAMPQLPSPGYTCAVFSLDSKTLYTGSTDGLVKAWDAESGQLTGSFKAHDGPVKALVLNPVRNQLASAGAENIVRLWDVDSTAQARAIAGHDGAVWTSSFSPDGKRIVSAGADRTIRLWDTATGKSLHTLMGHDAAVTAAVFSPDGMHILSGGGDALIKIWNADTGKLIQTCPGHEGAITSLDVSKDGRSIASGGADRKVIIWDAATGKRLITIADLKAVVAAVTFSPAGQQIAVGMTDGVIRLHDSATGKEQTGWPAHALAVSGLSYSPDGRWLASSGADSDIRVWPLATPGENARTLSGHAGPVSSVAFHADSQHIVSAGSDKTVKLWTMDNDLGREVQTYRGHRDWVTSAAFSRDGRYIVSSGVEHALKVWEISARTAEHTGSIEAVAVSPDGKWIATGATDKTIKLWESATGLERFALEGHNGGITSLAFTPDGKVLVSASADQSIRLWDAQTGKALQLAAGQLRAFTGLVRAAYCVVVAPDGKKLLVWVPAGDERFTTITALDLATGKELFSVNDQGRNIQSVAFSADCAWAATGALDGSVRVFDLDKKGALLPGGHWFPYQKGVGVGDIALTPDGRILVAGSDGGDVKIYEVAKKETLRTIKAHTSQVIACQVSFDGKRFATAGAEGAVKLWDLASGQELRTWNMHAGGKDKFIRTIVFTSDNKQLIIGNANATALILDLP